MARQDREFSAEEPTPGYALLKLLGFYSFVGGGVTNTITARLDNATNTLCGTHLSALKDVPPENGTLLQGPVLSELLVSNGRRGFEPGLHFSPAAAIGADSW